MLCTEIVPDFQNNFCTLHSLPVFCKKKSSWQRFTCTTVNNQSCKNFAKLPSCKIWAPCWSYHPNKEFLTKFWEFFFFLISGSFLGLIFGLIYGLILGPIFRPIFELIFGLIFGPISNSCFSFASRPNHCQRNDCQQSTCLPEWRGPPNNKFNLGYIE